MVGSFSLETPGDDPSTTNALMPFEPASPVRANTTYTSESPAFPMKRFWPFSTYTSPRFSARVCSAAGSEPTAGSVSA
jgi:hypothetical protein